MTDHDPDDLTRTHITLTRGTMVQQYQIVDRIGAGGMGEVFLADDSRLHRKVALKFLPAQMAQDESVRARFIREAQAAAGLDHPNVVTVYEVGEFEGRPYFAMQYVDGLRIDQFCRENSLTIVSIIGAARQIAEGLARAHSAGVVHRDIKSANIVVDRDGRPKILDFGLAAVTGGENITRAGSTMGTVAYMSPEQAQGKKVDARSDLFSLGVVMYELIAGRTPFKCDNDTATLKRLITEPPEPLARYKNDVPDEVQQIVLRALAKDPDERYQTAADMAAALKFAGNTLGSPTTGSSIGTVEARPSVAVIPFANMSADPENEFFSDGLTEELLNVLAKNPELQVTGRTSSFAFKGKQEDLRGIGQKLGVGTILEGSVRKAANRVRITAQLVKVSDGFHLWSETFDRVLEDIFAVQDDIAAAVAQALHVKLLGPVDNKPKIDSESYALVLKANTMARQYNAASIDAAEDLYNRALELDERNGTALAGLANVNIVRAAYGLGETIGGYQTAKRYAQQALDLDESIATAWEAMGWIRAAFEYNVDDARRSFARACELAPNDPAIISAQAFYDAVNGEFDQALIRLRKGSELDPLNPEIHMNYGKTLFWAEKYDQSLEALEGALKLSPGMASIYLTLGWIHLLEGRLDLSLESMNQEKSAGYRNCGLAMVYHAMGDKAKSDEALGALLDASYRESWQFQIATIYGYRGEVDQAYEWLDKGIAAKDAGIPITRVSIFMRSLHDDPRWPNLLRKIGMA